MEYFDEDIREDTNENEQGDDQSDKQEVNQEYKQEVNKNSLSDSKNIVTTENEIKPETIEISKKILNYLKPQESKYWRFSFKNESNMNQLKSVIESIPEYDLTVEFSFSQNTPDVIIKQDNTIVGKINLLLCDRRDANLPEKYYCKLYFYHFKNEILYQKVKENVINLFDKLVNASKSLKISGKSHNKKHNTIKRKHRIYKKKSMKRK
jgi:hypothetical protein